MISESATVQELRQRLGEIRGRQEDLRERQTALEATADKLATEAAEIQAQIDLHNTAEGKDQSC